MSKGSSFRISLCILTGTEGFSVCGSDETERRRKVYDQHFMVKAYNAYSTCFAEVVKEQAEKWKSNIDSPIPLTKTMSVLSLTALLRTAFGKDGVCCLRPKGRKYKSCGLKF